MPGAQRRSGVARKPDESTEQGSFRECDSQSPCEDLGTESRALVPPQRSPLGLQAEETDHKLCQPHPDAGAIGGPLNAGGKARGAGGPLIRVRVGDGKVAAGQPEWLQTKPDTSAGPKEEKNKGLI